MISFFRKIRQNLLSQSQVTRYLIYAIGEILLVVIGILIALSINNWNDKIKQNQVRDQLILSLQEDFKETARLINSSQENVDTLITNMESFFNLTQSEQPVSVDSLRRLALPFFIGVVFEPQLTSFSEAESNGTLSLLNSKELFKQMVSFNSANTFYKLHTNQHLQSYLNGTIADFRKSIGFTIQYVEVQNGFKQKDYKKLSLEEYREITNSPLTQAALESGYVYAKNVHSELIDMGSAVNLILEELERLSKSE